MNKFKQDFTDIFYRVSPASKAAYEGSLKKIMSVVNLKPTDHVIDLGCGSGALLKEVSKTTKNIFGIDSSKDMLKQSKIENPKIKVAYGDILNLNAQNSIFDIALSRAVFQHLSITQHKKFFSEAYRVLKPKGKFIMHAPTDSIPMRIPRSISKIVTKERKILSGTMYTTDYIKKALQESGFKKINIEYYGLFFYALSGYGTGKSLFIHNNREIWDALLNFDNYMLKIPGLKAFALNTIFICKK